MKPRLCIIGLILVLSPAAAAQTDWERYLKEPTPEHAARVQKATYTDPQDFLDHLIDDLYLLEVQVISGDASAVRLAFRLLDSSDGHYTETLHVMLGRVIRINPHLFLTELKQSETPSVRFAGLLGNFGFSYVDRFRAHRYEAERRIEALRSVTDPDLRALRDECVSGLRESLEQTEKILSEIE